MTSLLDFDTHRTHQFPSIQSMTWYMVPSLFWLKNLLMKHEDDARVTYGIPLLLDVQGRKF